MGIPCDDVVQIQPPEAAGEPTVITINCPDKIGLGCDLCRVILFFGLNIVRGDASTDGKWCYVVFWVVGRGGKLTRWGLLKKRLLGVCPTAPTASVLYHYQDWLQEMMVMDQKPQVFLLKFCCFDRNGLLHDVTQVLCELELTILKVKVSTTPDGRVIDLFFITDTRELLHSRKRKEETCDQLKSILGASMTSCEIEPTSGEITTYLQASPFLPPEISEEMFNLELPQEQPEGSQYKSYVPTVTVDNSLSPGHSLIQILCHDHKGLHYDVMRILKDYNIQLSYGRFYTTQKRCEIDLFVVQMDGKKILDNSKQEALCDRLRMEMYKPLRVMVLNRGPDTELFVANPVELSGNGRPLVFHDVTLALKILYTPIFLVLRMVDAEKKPAMGFIYNAMDEAKEMIACNLGGDEASYKEIWEIIDEKWELQLHRHLHAAGYYLNPQFQYADNKSTNPEIKLGLYHCMDRLIADPLERSTADMQLVVFRNKEGFFGLQQARDTVTKRSPVEWWIQFGDGTPELQRFAIKVLGLTCSSSGCERNWSSYNQVHTKRRNRLSTLRMNSLVYIMYNKKLKERYLKKKALKDNEDPLVCNDVRSDDEWFIDDDDTTPSELQQEDLNIDLFDGDRSNTRDPSTNTINQERKRKGKRKVNEVEEEEEDWDYITSADDDAGDKRIHYDDDSNEDPLSEESPEE